MGPRNRMTLMDSSKVTQWMLADTDAVAQMTPAELVDEIHAATGVTVSPGTAARHRKGIGIVAVKQPRERKPRGSGLAARVAALEEKVAEYDRRLEEAGA